MSVVDLALRCSPVKSSQFALFSLGRPVWLLKFRLTEVEKRAAKFISRFPFKFRRMGTRMKSSSTRRKTGQCYVQERAFQLLSLGNLERKIVRHITHLHFSEDFTS